AIFYRSRDISIPVLVSAILNFLTFDYIEQYRHQCHLVLGPRNHRFSRWNFVSILSRTVHKAFAVNRACLNMFDDFSYVIGGATIKLSKHSNRKIPQDSNAKNRMQKFASVLEILRKVWGG